jgi:membrane-bound serine protease (ClpP class)
MGCTDIRDCGRGAYCLALAFYKIQFEEIWYHEITNTVKELKVFGRIIMLKNMIITVIIIFIAVELIEHIIFPIVWSIFKGRKRSTYGVTGMIGKVVEIRRWNKTEGQVLINGELWSAVCEVPLPVGGKAVVRGVEGITLKLEPYENS